MTRPASDVRFRFTRSQINAGTQHEPGDEIDLPEAIACRLRDGGAGEFSSEPAAEQSVTPPTRKKSKRRK
jgi:hypothetical protein